jgi:predicted RNA-binding Zn-ribbon protein involved in translation (DUF1610 family)
MILALVDHSQKADSTADAIILVILAVLVPVVVVPVAIRIYFGIRSRLRHRVQDLHGVPQCETCGYMLTGNVSGNCPECGKIISFNNMAVIKQTAQQTK